ncbi:hypothetical protein [Ancylobacter sp.]|uniref:hypothetical protein n=1 Tax=Ancylobacter sp. TaxID=1872567 RepID=UPI003D0CCC6E
MKKTISIPMLGAVLAAAFVGPALADTNRPIIGGNSGWSPQTNQAQSYDRSANDGWSQRGQGTMIEGRNAATMEPNVQGVEPYIANSIEQNARSTN